MFYDTDSVNFMLPSDFLRPPLHIASLVWIDTNRFGLSLSDSSHFCLVFAGTRRRWQVELGSSRNENFTAYSSICAPPTVSQRDGKKNKKTQPPPSNDKAQTDRQTVLAPDTFIGNNCLPQLFSLGLLKWKKVWFGGIFLISPSSLRATMPLAQWKRSLLAVYLFTSVYASWSKKRKKGLKAKKIKWLRCALPAVTKRKLTK